MHVTPHVVGHRTVLEVHGEIDLDSAAGLSTAIEAALADGAHELWIDLTQTDFMDSTGLHLLLGTRERMRELNRRLAVVCPAGAVRRVFDLAGVDGRLALYADRDAAHRGLDFG
jgi:anti-anti-sigma factor